MQDLGLRVRSALPHEERACIGATLGYALQLEQFGIGLRASGCGSGFDNAVVSADSTATDLELEVAHLWDLDWARGLSVELGLALGASLWSQHFDSSGDAPSRQSVSPFSAIVVGAGFDLGAGVQLGAQVAAETHFLRIQTKEWLEPSSRVGFAVRSTLQVAKHF